GIGDTLPVDAQSARTDAALAAEPARADAVGQQHGKATLDEAQGPIPIARAKRAVAVMQAGAIVQADDRRKRAVAFRTEQDGLDRRPARLRNLDSLRLGRGEGWACQDRCGYGQGGENTAHDEKNRADNASRKLPRVAKQWQSCDGVDRVS